ncbi:threonine/serine exporter family protein [Paenibacillus sp. HN-1]|uniref:threonine/serine exporter family protein n=1 Tax=Paenibacillus TaxID=44249 RepID=UPI001CA918AF|nr:MULTISPECIES: threonine/serine exporter family protein [Paenibacillus]MBY9079652.1 threonine/serine exporter family protein [Paenibacillus sp. CGMCC 1.18879]MBY9082903.1 threonine/serine exporter family protein [Paenibacillus sinensis]
MDSPENNTQNNNIYEIIDLCLFAGKIMLQNGAETYRVEDTMTRMAAALGFPGAHSYVTPTVILFTTSRTEQPKLFRIAERTTDLQKVAQVNDISRRLSQRELTSAQAREELAAVDDSAHAYPAWLRVAAAALAGGCFTIMFNGQYSDALPAMFVSGIGYAAAAYLQRLAQIRFFAELTASILIGLLSYLAVQAGIGAETDKIIIGSVMPLVPGLLITNAVRDLMAGHLISGLSKGAEAFLTAFAIGTGIGLVLSFVA